MSDKRNFINALKKLLEAKKILDKHG